MSTMQQCRSDPPYGEPDPHKNEIHGRATTPCATYHITRTEEMQHVKHLSLSEFKDYIVSHDFDRYFFDTFHQPWYSDADNMSLSCSYDTAMIFLNPNCIFFTGGCGSMTLQRVIEAFVDTSVGKYVVFQVVCGKHGGHEDRTTYTFLAE